MSITYSKRQGVWRAGITKSGVVYHLGSFATEAEAKSAYDRAKSGEVAEAKQRRELGVMPMPFSVPPAPPYRSRASRVPLFPKTDPDKEAQA